MQTVKAVERDSIRAESFSQVIYICRGNMDEERDPASQSQFSSPVQGFWDCAYCHCGVLWITVVLL